MAEKLPGQIALYEPAGLEDVVFPEPLDDRLVHELLGPMISDTPNPWRLMAEKLRRVHRMLADCEKHPLPADFFEPSVGEGWYLRQIVACEQRVRYQVARNNASWAAFGAFELGQVFQEWQLKFAHEKDAVFGAQRRAELTEGALARRKGLQAHREAEVDRLHQKGVSKRRAFALVGKAEGGTSARTIEGDYYQAKKKASVS